MPSLDQTIRGLFQVAALAVSGMPPQNQIAFENRVFSSVPGTPWARLTLVPASSRPLGTNVSTIEHRGLFLIDLFYPASDGTGAVESLANTVKDAFRPGLRLVMDGVAVGIDYAERSRAMEQKPDWLMLSVTVAWHCFSPLN